MQPEEKRCGKCNLVISSGELFVRQKRPGTKGASESDYEYFHRREPKDCYWKWCRDFIVEAQKKLAAMPQHSTPYLQ